VNWRYNLANKHNKEQGKHRYIYSAQNMGHTWLNDLKIYQIYPTFTIQNKKHLHSNKTSNSFEQT